jgi:hypothetical protein
VVAFLHCSCSANDNGIAVEELTVAGVVTSWQHRLDDNIAMAVSTEHFRDVIHDGENRDKKKNAADANEQ